MATAEQVEKERQRLLQKCKTIMTWKSKGYTGQVEDKLSNFKVAAAEFKIAHLPVSPKLCLWGYLLKHLTSIRYMCSMKKNMPSRLEWDEKLVDSINYLILLSAMVTEELEEEKEETGKEREDCLYPRHVTFNETELQYGRNSRKLNEEEMKTGPNHNTKKGFIREHVKKEIERIAEDEAN